MLDPKYIREHPEEVKRNAANRHVDVDIDAFLKLDGKRNTQLRKAEDLRAKRNEIADAMKKGKGDGRDAMIAEGKALKDKLVKEEASLKKTEEAWSEILHRIPNLTHPDAPIGGSDEQNVEIRTFGTPTTGGKTHEELVGHLMDFERGAKTAGSKFYFLKDELAILEQAFLRYAIDYAMSAGFTFMTVPEMVREEILRGKGFLPRGPEKQVYFIDGEDLAMIGTAEIPLLGYHMKETLAEGELPKKYVAFSHCYRTESGAYGRESAGLYRVHQFAKVELFAYTLPEHSEKTLEEFVRLEEAFWKTLDVPYRIVDCCTGDLGGSDYRRYDMEAWMQTRNGGKGGYGEVSSASNCGDYQSRNLGIQVKKENGERVYAHTLNATMAASPRPLIAILENHQNADGSVSIPKPLQAYTGFKMIKQ